eukprot:3085678-Karenia_brevis.AAC.1
MELRTLPDEWWRAYQRVAVSAEGKCIRKVMLLVVDAIAWSTLSVRSWISYEIFINYARSRGRNLSLVLVEFWQ